MQPRQPTDTLVQGLVGAAFLWGYMATQLLGGRLADMYGGKRVIAAAIAFFSFASVLPPLLADIVPASSILTLVIISRFLGVSLLHVTMSLPHAHALSQLQHGTNAYHPYV